MYYVIPDEIIVSILGGIILWAAWVTRRVLRSVDQKCATRIETKTDVVDAKLNLLLDHLKIPYEKKI